jgi:hypothetical protein
MEQCQMTSTMGEKMASELAPQTKAHIPANRTLAARVEIGAREPRIVKELLNVGRQELE